MSLHDAAASMPTPSDRANNNTATTTTTTTTTTTDAKPQAPTSTSTSTRASKMMMTAVTTTEVCCTSCFRPSRRRRFRKLSASISSRILFFHPTFYDAQEQLQQQEEDPSGGGGGYDNQSDWDKESLFYFDAEQEPLAEGEYPIIFTDFLAHPKPDVSLAAPESMLRQKKLKSPLLVVNFAHDKDKDKDKDNDDEEPEISLSASSEHNKKVATTATAVGAVGAVGVGVGDYRRQLSAPIANHKERSQRFQQLMQRSDLEQQQELEEPRVKITLQGYPGDLTVAELAECQKFSRGLRALDPAISEQVYSFRDVEEEPYTICRWLRATKFKADEILQRLEENQPLFETARDNDFYPDVSKAIGAPFSVFLSQYPFLPIGRGKNGCPVNYFLAGRINPEGIMSLTTAEMLQGYFWWSFMYKFKQEIRKAQAEDPDFVRVEGINILDLKGLSAAALSSETIDVVKLASKISDFFPETLHCMLIINAPGFFSMFWGLLKKFIDPRTAQRIQVFSNPEKGLAALRQLVAVEEIPVDYGGTNKSVKQAFMEEAADPLLKKQEIELLQVKKRGGRVDASTEWKLEADEYMEVRVFTRSVSPGNVTVEFNDKVYARKAAKCKWENHNSSAHPSSSENGEGGGDGGGDGGEGGGAEGVATTPTNGNGGSSSGGGGGSNKPLPKCNVIVEALHGPGTVKIGIMDLDIIPDNKKASVHPSSSRGSFLLVCDIKATTATTSSSSSSSITKQ